MAYLQASHIIVIQRRLFTGSKHGFRIATERFNDKQQNRRERNWKIPGRYNSKQSRVASATAQRCRSTTKSSTTHRDSGAIDDFEMSRGSSGDVDGEIRCLVSAHGWKVRRMVEEDREIRKVSQIQAEAFHVKTSLFNDLFFQFFQAEVLSGLLYRLRNSPPDRYACLVAEAATGDSSPDSRPPELVGVVDVTVLREKGVLEHLQGAEEYLYVSGIAVSHNYRRRKIATVLLKACERISILWGYKYLVLRAYEDDLGARALYMNAGFQVVSGDPFWVAWCYSQLWARRRWKNEMGKNLENAVIAFLAPLPSILFYVSFISHYNNPHHSLYPLYSWCYHHPLLLANAFFFFNVNLLFWLIGLVQSSHWMIDPYWTAIPVLLVHYYAAHPLLSSSYNIWRSRVAMILTWVWSIRLSHNYFRREHWQWGAREDWRFTDMRHQYGNNWWWVSFFAIYVSQEVFLIGVTLPLYIIHSVDRPWSMWDFAAIFVCLSGIIIAYYADTQLHEFVTKNCELKERGMPTVPTLEKGLWRYSRHPNYFGEQLWWWGLVIFSWSLGHGWTFVGALINSMCLAYVTFLVEDRMLKQSHRAEAYRQYQKTTSAWIPWFKSSPGAKDKSH
ncbi:hypothetical protein Nepgr_002194 [Nepenthes gracilis]|uniref:N-acetyltransferase domain-containing protein n=1 Tax=Nepenthes gracilis TaxID=150966 RepID=A0AAD3P7H8_NEPGR|nr:hypothetical protein Nepgr_002194 [Nepenthes gracilis]